MVFFVNFRDWHAERVGVSPSHYIKLLVRLRCTDYYSFPNRIQDSDNIETLLK